MKYWLPDKAYNILKWLCILALPALGWAYGELAPDWGWPDAGKVCHALDVVGTVVGVLIGYSTFTAKPGPSIDPDATSDLGRRIPEV